MTSSGEYYFQQVNTIIYYSPSVVRDVEIHNQPVLRMRRK
jgi:hypothetical protein